MIRHFFTVDVEEYFQVSCLEDHLPRSGWDAQESRVERNVEDLLELMARWDTRGTFFVLGWIANRYPGIVRRIAEGGHEIASHGWAHRRITDLSPAGFRTSVRLTRQILEDLTGKPVIGYRAPSFSIVPEEEWAFDVLIEEGYRYDSSLFPIRRPGYGYPGAFRDPHWVLRSQGQLLEFPPATLRFLGANLPAGGGGYLRLLPLALLRKAFATAGERGVPATFYLHPWEIDPDQPRIPVPWPTRVRHYGGLHRTRGRLNQLLQEFRFRPIGDFLQELAPHGSLRRNRGEVASLRRVASFPIPPAIPVSA